MVEEELSKIESSMVAPDDDIMFESKKDRWNIKAYIFV